MKNRFKVVIAVISFIAAIIIFTEKTQADFTLSNANDSTNNSFTQKSNSARTLYLNNCARCHGADGRGETELGKLYSATNLTDRKVKRSSRKRAARIIQNGEGSMPGFKNKLKAAEINSLVSYIKTL